MSKHERLETVERLARRHKIKAWLFAAAKQFYEWPQGRLLTEAAFQAMIDKVKNHTPEQ
jgi:hypothetical protein